LRRPRASHRRHARALLAALLLGLPAPGEPRDAQPPTLEAAVLARDQADRAGLRLWTAPAGNPMNDSAAGSSIVSVPPS
jgi:hypothetical protein